MLRYKKGPEPEVLNTLRTTPGASWTSAGSAQKDDIRSALLKDQRHLCCYCQRRIPVSTAPKPGMRIEHWRARSEGGEEFVWTNLLGACPGDESAEKPDPSVKKRRKDRLHCDNSRGNTPLFLHPVKEKGPDPREFLRYSGAGVIRSDNPQAQRDVDQTLNLNARHLKRGRIEVFKALQTRLGEKKTWTAKNLRDRLSRLNKGEKAPEHVEFARYHLKRWLTKIPA